MAYPMDATELAKAIQDEIAQLEVNVKRLRMEYEQYFRGSARHCTSNSCSQHGRS